MYSKLSALLTLFGVVAVNATAAPDNFFFSFEKDLKTFGVNRNRRKRDAPKVEEVKTSSSSPSLHVDVDVDDDFNRAEGKFFHAVENIEKKAINVAHSLIHDEVDVLFGKDHGHHHEQHEQRSSMDMDRDHGHLFHLPIFGGHRRGSESGSNKKNHVRQVSSSTEINVTDNDKGADEKLLNFMESYAENCFNPHGGW